MAQASIETIRQEIQLGINHTELSLGGFATASSAIDISLESSAAADEEAARNASMMAPGGVKATLEGEVNTQVYHAELQIEGARGSLQAAAEKNREAAGVTARVRDNAGALSAQMGELNASANIARSAIAGTTMESFQADGAYQYALQGTNRTGSYALLQMSGAHVQALADFPSGPIGRVEDEVDVARQRVMAITQSTNELEASLQAHATEAEDISVALAGIVKRVQDLRAGVATDSQMASVVSSDFDGLQQDIQTVWRTLWQVHEDMTEQPLNSPQLKARAEAVRDSY
jgi:hypothetical protein